MRQGTALILPKARCVRSENAVLQFAMRMRTVSRDHSIALVEDGKGQRLVVCSLHLHPPEMIQKNRGRYKQYLEPLQQAVESLAGVEDGLLQTPCLLLGDFNVSPEHFQQLTSTVDFWRQLLVMWAGRDILSADQIGHLTFMYIIIHNMYLCMYICIYILTCIPYICVYIYDK